MPVGHYVRLSDAQPGAIVYFSGKFGSGYGLVGSWDTGAGTFVAEIKETRVLQSEHSGFVYVIPNATIEPVIRSSTPSKPCPAGGIAFDTDAMLMCELTHGHLFGVELETGLCRYPDAIRGYFASWAICADGQPDELIRVNVF